MLVGGKYFNSLDPIVTCDPSSLPTERVVPLPGTVARVTIANADPRLEAQVAGHNLLTLLGSVSGEGPYAAFLSLKVDGNFFTCSLNRDMLTDDIVAEIIRRLPPGYQAVIKGSSMSDVIVLAIGKRSRGPVEPELRFLSTDASQHFSSAGINRIRIQGCAEGGESMRSHLELYLEGYRLRLPLAGGDSPFTTAQRLRDALPKRYTALIELPHEHAGDVTLTILRRR